MAPRCPDCIFFGVEDKAQNQPTNSVRAIGSGPPALPYPTLFCSVLDEMEFVPR